MYFEVVKTIAEVSGALIGFIGVVFVLGGRAVRELNVSEKSGLRHLLIGSVGTLLISVLVMILLAVFEEGMPAWRIGNGIIAIWVFAGSTTAIREELRGEHSLPVPINWALPITALGFVIFNAVTAAGGLDGMAPVACVSALLLGLVVAIAYFISLLTGYFESRETDG